MPAFLRYLSQLFSAATCATSVESFCRSGVHWVRRHMAAMQKSHRIRDARNKTPYRETKPPDIHAPGSCFGKVLTQAVSIVKRSRQLLRRHVQPNMAKVVNGR